MTTTATFFHAGCPVCVEAEQNLAHSLDPSKYKLEIVHLGTDKSRLPEAQSAGVKSVPALVIHGTPFHINYGAALADLA